MPRLAASASIRWSSLSDPTAARSCSLRACRVVLRWIERRRPGLAGGAAVAAAARAVVAPPRPVVAPARAVVAPARSVLLLPAGVIAAGVIATSPPACARRADAPTWILGWLPSPLE